MDLFATVIAIPDPPGSPHGQLLLIPILEAEWIRDARRRVQIPYCTSIPTYVHSAHSDFPGQHPAYPQYDPPCYHILTGLAPPPPLLQLFFFACSGVPAVIRYPLISHWSRLDRPAKPHRPTELQRLQSTVQLLLNSTFHHTDQSRVYTQRTTNESKETIQPSRLTAEPGSLQRTQDWAPVRPIDSASAFTYPPFQQLS